jgi:hypothetical protein
MLAGMGFCDGSDRAMRRPVRQPGAERGVATDAPRWLDGMPASYAVFRRMAIPDVMRAIDATHSRLVQLVAGGRFQHVLQQHMGYWEERVPAGKHSFTGDADYVWYGMLLNAVQAVL